MSRSRFNLSSALLTLNNNLAASSGRYKGVVVRGDHAWFQVKHNGKVYVFNGNDGEDGIPHHYPPSADGSAVTGAVRALADREEKILVHPKGLCFLVAAAFSIAYKKIGKNGEDWDAFMDFAHSCTEESLYFYIKSQ